MEAAAREGGCFCILLKQTEELSLLKNCKAMANNWQEFVTKVSLNTSEAEDKLKKLTEELINEAANHASLHECSPISDIRASADYRRELVRLSVRDGLMLAIKEDK